MNPLKQLKQINPLRPLKPLKQLKQLKPLNPLKLAIIGAGPSAFYVASRVLKLLPLGMGGSTAGSGRDADGGGSGKETMSERGSGSGMNGKETRETTRNVDGKENSNVRVHLYDRLWAPYGLVRYGVAPDHPEVKNCTHKFRQTAQDARFEFFGGVNVVSSASSPSSAPTAPTPHPLTLPLSTLFKSYTHILFATGCTQPTLHPSIPPSSRCVPASEVVGWYTGNPTSTPSSPSPLHHPNLTHIHHVTIIGHGNVALDIARLLLSPFDALSTLDIPRSVLEVMERSGVRHVSVVGRRGLGEASFGVKEVREMMRLEGVGMRPLEEGLLRGVGGEGGGGGTELTRRQKRMVDLLKKGSRCEYGTTEKSWSLEFFRSPVGLTESHPSAQLSLAHTILDPTTHRAIPTGEISSLSTDLVITSLGFHGEPSAPFYDPILGHIRTALGGGGVITADGKRVERVYASGWAAMGAKGVLAATMMNAYGVADEIVGDWGGGVNDEEEEGGQTLDSLPEVVQRGLEEGTVVTYDDWLRVDEEEIRRGAQVGKERERMTWEDVRTFLKT
ncbi:hypothetical protein CPB83DRAFT_877584 [Crepidotus variabilis]|uniref:NADPH:adrenodoxin oxidoreductase, mitochondrial n=1 Tax=Crepidotus variabilis TaxID=179855 RepID=A0A9P6E901_9AGAR|nr:hypothetical protein CPB83DRAFT_877584 [Crepidotus variabilis]